MSIRNISMFIGCMCVTSTIGVADIWFDPTGDIATGNPNLDITSFEITDNGSDLFMTIEVADISESWGHYMIFMDLFAGVGSGDNDNPWGRNVSGLEGADAFMGGSPGWGGQYYDGSSGSGWDQWYSDSDPNGDSTLPFDVSTDYANNSFTFTFATFVTQAINEGLEGFNFEVGTTGGNWGDPAIDLLNGTGGSWGEGSTGAWEYYQFSTVPAPGALVLLTIAGFSRKRRI